MLPRALRNTVFARLLTGDLLRELASTATFIVLPLVAFERSGSGEAFAMVMLGGSIGRLVAMPIGGVLADRFDRRRIMLTGDAILFLLLGAIVATVHWELWALLAVAQCAQNVTGSLVDPAGPALRRDVVAEHERKQSASLMQLTQSVTLLLGPLMGVALYGLAGFGVVVAVDAAALVCSFVLIATIRHPATKVERPEAAPTSRSLLVGAVRATGADITAAAGAARRDPYLAASMAMAPFTGAANGFFNIAFVPWIVGPLGHSAEIIGPLVATIGAAGIASGLLLTRIIDRYDMATLTRVAATGSLIFPLLIVGTPDAVRLFLAFALLGANEAVWNISTTVLRQKRIPSALQGRIPSLWQTLFLVTNVASIALGGMLIGRLEPQTLMLIASGCWLALAPMSFAMAVYARRPAPLVDAHAAEPTLAISG